MTIELVQECWYVEGNLATSFTTRNLQQPSEVDAREVKTIIVMDWNQALQQALSHQSSKMVSNVAQVTSWMKIWDVTLDKDQEGPSPCWYCSLRSLSACLWQQTMSILWHRETRFITVSPPDGNPPTWPCTCARRPSENLSIASRHRLTLRYFLYCWIFFYIELYIFRLFYIWMPLSVSIITFEPLLVPYIPHLQQV